MPDAIAFVLDNGMTVAVAAARRPGSSAVGLSDRLEAAEKTLREALVPVTAAAAQVIDGFRAIDRRPEEIEICFGVTLDGKLGGVIASANAGAHLDVTLRWHGSSGTADDDVAPV
jgi:Trypsin-co-occurring domain 1